MFPPRLLVLIMCVLSLQVGGDCETTGSKRVRRFMWKQMDNTVDGIMNGMASSARAMKSMIGDFMPALHTTSPTITYTTNSLHTNVLDFLPSETTRVKYIIRKPTSTTTRVKYRTPKKVIKLMSKPKNTAESKPRKEKNQYPSIEELRKMEKKQEMIAEGRIPAKPSDTESQSATKAEKHTSEHTYSSDGHHDTVISSHIQEFRNGWSPVYEASKEPAAFSTIKTFPMSSLHTSIIGGESLPKPEKQVYEHDEETEPEERHLGGHTYEVNEFTAEESVALPLHSNQRSSRPFLPTRLPPIHALRSSTTTTTTTTTTEAPNYPATFLKKYRERPPAVIVPHPKVRFKPSDPVVSNGWLPASSNAPQMSFKIKHHPPLAAPVHHQQQEPQQQPQHQNQQQHQYSQNARLKSEKWPPEVMPSSRPFVASANTEPPAPEHTTEPIRMIRTSAKLRSTPPLSDSGRPMHIRGRGSVRFGDKLQYEQF